MILIDYNQVFIGGIMAHINDKKNENLDENLIRHQCLNILRNQAKTFRKEYGDLVICCDNRKYWRKEVFPHYKAGRKKSRSRSIVDWNYIFDVLAKIKEEIKENFPYKVIDVEGAEADDIIGTLVPYKINSENILIISRDNDFVQLQKYNSSLTKSFKVRQYDTTLKEYIVSKNPDQDLKHKIIIGDTGDGIPNILSEGDCFVREIRQTPMTKNKLEIFMEKDYSLWEDAKAKTGYSRNRMLIDLDMIPDEIRSNIINTFESIKPAAKQKLLPYFIQYKLRNLMGVIEEF